MVSRMTQLAALVADLQEKAALECVGEALAAGEDPLRIMEQCQEGLRLVGKRYEEGIYYISGLIMSGEIMRQVGELIFPVLERQVSADASGRILLGTVAGDIHFIGKNLLKVLLRCHGFTVRDAGEDVPAERFVELVQEFKPHAVGLSCLLTTAYDSLKDTVALLRRRPPAQGVPIVIGGRVDGKVCAYVKADHWAGDATTGIRLFQSLSAARVAMDRAP